MRHFNVSWIVWAKSQDSVHKPQFLKRKESRSGSNRGPSAHQLSALPLGHTGSRRVQGRGQDKYARQTSYVQCGSFRLFCPTVYFAERVAFLSVPNSPKVGWTDLIKQLCIGEGEKLFRCSSALRLSLHSTEEGFWYVPCSCLDSSRGSSQFPCYCYRGLYGIFSGASSLSWETH